MTHVVTESCTRCKYSFGSISDHCLSLMKERFQAITAHGLSSVSQPASTSYKICSCVRYVHMGSSPFL